MSEMDTVRSRLERREADVSAREEAHRVAGESLRETRNQLEVDKRVFQRMQELLDAKDVLLVPRPNESQNAVKTVRSAVVKAVEDLAAKKEEFTSVDVINVLSAVPQATLGFDVAKNRANVSTYMTLLVREGVIDVVRQGTGRRPTVYMLKKGGAS